MKVSITLIATAAALSVVACSPSRGKRINEDVHYDYLMLASHWPPAQCLVANEHEAGSCAYPQNSTQMWPLHGLWPSTFGSHLGPTYCKGLPYDKQKVDPLRQELTVLWPNILPHTSADSFWSHEWTKHGKCATANTTSAPPTLRNRGEAGYFGTAMQLLKKMNIKEKIAKVGINPSDRRGYKLTVIQSAVGGAFGGKKAHYECVKETSRNRWLLASIRLCIDKEFTVIDCAPQQNGIAENDVHLTSYHSNGLPVNEPCPGTLDIWYVPDPK